MSTNGKIQCLICGKFFTRPCSHAVQVHGVTAREYKEVFGFDKKKGIATDEYKEKMREHVVDNYNKVVARNLLKNGKQSRFKKGDTTIGKYERSAQTIERIRGYNRKRYPRSKRVTKPCDECGTPVSRTESAISKFPHTFCSRSCSTKANNRGRAKT